MEAVFFVFRIQHQTRHRWDFHPIRFICFPSAAELLTLKASLYRYPDRSVHRQPSTYRTVDVHQ